MSEKDNDPITALRTDVMWIKNTISEIKEKIDVLAEGQSKVASEVSAVKQKVKMHDQIIAAMIGAGATAFLWILAHLI